MSYDRQKVIDWARSQIGYKEKATNAQLDDFNANAGANNWNKYARDLDKLGNFYNGPKNIGPQGAWCDIFVDDGFVEAYGREAAQYLLCQPNNSAGAGCQFSASYFNSKGQFYKSNPQPGDQIFFGSSWQNIWHTGLVVAVSNGYITTIEGNTSNMVAERRYSVSDKNIWGFGRPKWEDESVKEEERETFTITFPKLTIGDGGAKGKNKIFVIILQTLLIWHGYNCGGRKYWGHEFPDGDYGKKTESAVGQYQKMKNIPASGDVDKETIISLLS